LSSSPPASGTAPSSTRSVVEAYLAALNRGAADLIASLVSPHFFNEHTAQRGSSLRGRNAYREQLPGFLRRFGGLHYAVEAFIVEGPQAAVAYQMSFRWAPAQGAERAVTTRGMFRFEVNDGLIVHRVDYWDSAVFDAQVGAPR
jgi:ketosteroid isomerase-like protein